MWVQFTAPFRWKPNRSTVIYFCAGDLRCVPRRCGTEAIAAGKAIPAANPKARKSLP